MEYFYFGFDACLTTKNLYILTYLSPIEFSVEIKTLQKRAVQKKDYSTDGYIRFLD